MEAPVWPPDRDVHFILLHATAACLDGSLVWVSDVPGNQIRFHLSEPGWKANEVSSCVPWILLPSKPPHAGRFNHDRQQHRLFVVHRYSFDFACAKIPVSHRRWETQHCS